MQRSNAYILIYTIILTVVCGVVLATASMGLKPLQEANKELEKKTNIISTVMSTEGMTKDQIVETYNTRVNDFVVDYNGKKIEGKKGGEIDVAKEYKKPLEERMFPVYEIKSEKNPGQIEYYVVPVFGFGLWNNIWGFVSLKSDLNTINGVKFQHTGETPGLGARIADDEAVPARYIGKKLFDEKGELKSVVMQKGEGNNYDTEPHKVDGMSGATLTGKGVNNMLADYFKAYQNYFKTTNTSTTLK